MGFQKKPSIDFIHHKDRILPTTSTCDVILHLPTRHRNNFKEMMVLGNDGFGGVGFTHQYYANACMHFIFTELLLASTKLGLLETIDNHFITNCHCTNSSYLKSICLHNKQRKVSGLSHPVVPRSQVHFSFDTVH